MQKNAPAYSAVEQTGSPLLFLRRGKNAFSSYQRMREEACGRRCREHKRYNFTAEHTCLCLLHECRKDFTSEVIELR